MKVNQFDPYLTKDEIKSVSQTIKENWITEGRKTKELQEMLQKYCGAKHAIMLPNGTLALYVALKIVGIGPGDEVIVPAFTFVGSATSITLTGAKPVFCDVNLDDFNMSIESLKACLSPRTKAIMPVHIYGQAVKNFDQVMAIAKERKLLVVEDAAQGLGVKFGKKHVGTFGEVGCISFYADKTITMGEGGVLLTNDDALADRCRYFKNQGRLNRGSFIHPQMGFNFRITDLQAAIGVVQMKKLKMIIDRKAENEALYKKFLKDCSQIEFPKDIKAGKRVPFRINILTNDPEKLGDFLTEKDIGIRRFFYPLNHQPCFTDDNSIRNACPNADKIFSKGLSLPSGVGLTTKQIKYVCDNILKFYD
jgi:perosamine synthetase